MSGGEDRELIEARMERERLELGRACRPADGSRLLWEQLMAERFGSDRRQVER